MIDDNLFHSVERVFMRKLSLLDEDDEVYGDDYIETTTDPGDTFLYIAIVICICSIACLPLFVKLGKWCISRRTQESDEHQEENVGTFVAPNGAAPHPAQTDSSNLSCVQRCRRRKMCYSAAMFVLDNVIRRRKRGAHAGENIDRRREAVSRGVAREARESMLFHQQVGQQRGDVYLVGDSVVGTTLQNTELEVSPEDENSSNQTDPLAFEVEKAEILEIAPTDEDGTDHQLEVHDADNAKSPPTPLCSFVYLRKSVQFMWTVVKYDNETKRILRLAVPFTFSALLDTTAELITLAMISNYLGTDAAVAFAMVDIVVGITSEFSGGWVEALSSLGSQAYGAGNYELVGQIVQTSCIAFVLQEIPFAIVWYFTIDKIMLLMGFDDTVAVLAKDFVWVQVAMNIMDGINEALFDFLEVVEKEAYANIISCVGSFTQVGLVALFAIQFDADLVVCGLVMLTNDALLFFINVLISNQMGWLRLFEGGLFGQCSLMNRTVLSELFKVALPLAFGNVLAYAEWEVLTVFAAVLGPAEAATWAFLGFVWDVFESTTEAIGDAGEVRCAYQMGKGRPALAELSSYKSMLMGVIMALSVTAVFLGLSNYLPYWLTQDPTIQSMLVELFPLMALGNITMTTGMVCWALIGAQGRYRLATVVATACSVLIVIPLGAIFAVWLRIDLQGLTFAVVVGYTVTATLLSTILLCSDWEKLSEKIVALVAEDNGSESDDDSSSSSSRSSSSSSGPSSRSDAQDFDGVEWAPLPPVATPTQTPEDKQSHGQSDPQFSADHQRHQTEALPSYLRPNESPPQIPPRTMASDRNQTRSLSRLHELAISERLRRTKSRRSPTLPSRVPKP